MQTKLILLVKDVKRTWEFYTAVGIKWLAGEDQLTPQSFPLTDCMGLPQLWGSLGGIELIFFRSEDSKSTACDNRTQFVLNLDDESALTEIIADLEAKQFLTREAVERDSARVIIADPDGREIELCLTTPFRL